MQPSGGLCNSQDGARLLSHLCVSRTAAPCWAFINLTFGKALSVLGLIQANVGGGPATPEYALPVGDFSDSGIRRLAVGIVCRPAGVQGALCVGTNSHLSVMGRGLPDKSVSLFFLTHMNLGRRAAPWRDGPAESPGGAFPWNPKVLTLTFRHCTCMHAPTDTLARPPPSLPSREGPAFL